MLAKIALGALAAGALLGVPVVAKLVGAPNGAYAPGNALSDSRATESKSLVVAEPPESRSSALPSTRQTPPDTLTTQPRTSSATRRSDDTSFAGLERQRDSELRLLMKMREVLAIDPNQALHLAEEHRRRFGFGTFGEEREALAIEAMVKVGHESKAWARLERFRARFPHSVYTERLSVRLEQGE